MTRRGQIEYSMRRYGVPLCVEGTQGVGFLRALNTKSGQEPEEYWCAVQAGLGLREGALEYFYPGICCNRNNNGNI